MWNHIEQALHDSMVRVTTKIATLLPGILAFIVALLIFLVLAWIAEWNSIDALPAGARVGAWSFTGTAAQYSLPGRLGGGARRSKLSRKRHNGCR